MSGLPGMGKKVHGGIFACLTWCSACCTGFPSLWKWCSLLIPVKLGVRHKCL